MVEVNQDCKCNGLNLSLRWKTHGRGNVADEEVYGSMLFQGTWRAGQTHSYPFRMTLPSGPASYHGHYLNVDWYVRAQADIPWALDPKAEIDILVAPGAGAGAYIPGKYQVRNQAHRHMRTRTGGSWLEAVLGLWMAAMSCLITAVLVEEAGVSGASLLAIALGGLLTLFGLSRFYKRVRNPLSRLLIGKIDVELEPGRVHPGGEVRCRIRFATKKAAVRNSIWLTLVGREECVSGSGTDKTTYTHSLLERTIPLRRGSAKPLPTGKGVVIEEVLRLPEDAPYSFYAPDNQLVWLVEVHIDVPRWSDYIGERFVEVVPPMEDGGLVQGKMAGAAPAVERTW